MDGGGEGGRVGEVQPLELVHRGPQGDGGDADIRHLVHRTGTQDLDAQELPGGPVGGELDEKDVRAGVVVGLVVHGGGGGDHVVSFRPCGGLGEARAARVDAAGELRHAGAEAGVMPMTGVALEGVEGAEKVEKVLTSKRRRSRWQFRLF